MKKLLVLILSAALLLSVCAGFCSCSDGSEDEEIPTGDVTDDENGENQSGGGNATDGADDGNGDDDGADDAPELREYALTVKSKGGMPLEYVEVSLYCSEGALDIKKTDGTGRVKFTTDITGDVWAEFDGSELRGYDFDAVDKLWLTEGENELSVETKLEEGSIESLPVYEPGDVVCDFSITDVNGKTYTVSEILAEKELLVLNFWYVNCNFCIKEFPFMSSAYDEYSDRVEILAINDYGDSLGEIRNLEIKDSQGNPVQINFPTFKSDVKMAEKFDPSHAYPLTVCIDRHGMISMVHVGGIVSEEPFIKIFEFYTSPDYVQTVVEDIEDITG